MKIIACNSLHTINLYANSRKKWENNKWYLKIGNKISETEIIVHKLYKERDEKKKQESSTEFV